uniref:Transmembrane protein n=1 Tax=Cacopsylla melanoneura TaxID=428564 RepID=A0A8D8RA30_9HEMI
MSPSLCPLFTLLPQFHNNTPPTPTDLAQSSTQFKAKSPVWWKTLIRNSIFSSTLISTLVGILSMLLFLLSFIYFSIQSFVFFSLCCFCFRFSFVLMAVYYCIVGTHRGTKILRIDVKREYLLPIR